MQARVGKREHIEGIGRRVLRPFLPEQHREFFAQLPFVVVGSIDVEGNSWASLLFGEPGFVESPAPEVMTIRSQPQLGDPLRGALSNGVSLSVLGIELATRRRNRANLRVASASPYAIEATVEQSLGQCPKYIQKRPIERASPLAENSFEVLGSLDAAATALIRKSNTFFVASQGPALDGGGGADADVSHRGGPAGFAHVEDGVLSVPDYVGNSFFNTMGNFLITPRAGLVFVDFESRDILMLSGDVDVVLDAAGEEGFAGAERGWKFRMKSGVRLRGAWPFRTLPT